MKLLSLLPFLPLVEGGSKPLAKTLNGTYAGRHVPSLAQDFFLGIPFAHAPLLSNPISINDSWTGHRSAEQYGPICHQLITPELINRTGIPGLHQECLNLNIIRPAGWNHNDEKLPVLVWLYGGGFVDGFGADLNSNFSYVVQKSVEIGKPILAVTLNYRTSILGFPFGEEVKNEGVANLGLKDQRMALRWMQENIGAFGGDRNKVTLWGQSAGAISIVGHLLAYGGRDEGLFHRGVVISGGVGIANTGNVTRPDRVRAFEEILKGTGCEGKGLDCLRGVDAETLFEVGQNVSAFSLYWTVIDGDILREPASVQVLKGEFVKSVQLVVGTNSDEGLAWLGSVGEMNTEADVVATAKQYFRSATNETIQKLVDAYPENEGPPFSLPLSETGKLCEGLRTIGMKCGPQSRRLGAILGDYGILYGRRTLARKFAELGLAAYSYRFDTWPTSFPVQGGNFRPGFASHSTEYSYFLNYGSEHNLYGNNPVVANSSSHRALAHGISSKLVAFVHSGDPNIIQAPGFPAWPRYSVEKPANLVFNATAEPDALNVHVESDTYRQEAFSLFEGYPYELDVATR
ncbi:hypothetical protein OQA88_10625 [Cercophora sp. LCS_1]